MNQTDTEGTFLVEVGAAFGDFYDAAKESQPPYVRYILLDLQNPEHLIGVYDPDSQLVLGKKHTVLVSDDFVTIDGRQLLRTILELNDPYYTLIFLANRKKPITIKYHPGNHYEINLRTVIRKLVECKYVTADKVGYPEVIGLRITDAGRNFLSNIQVE